MLIASLLLLESLSQLPMAAVPPDNEEGRVAMFEFESDGKDWRIIDDGVMGGRSQGSWRVASGVGEFAGTLSLENNGGFSSVRSKALQTPCDGAEAFTLRVKGDGRRYQFRVRTTDAFDGPSYRLEFDTVAGEWKEISLKLADFVPSFRGRELTGQPPLEGKNVVTIGFLLADKRAGEFRLEVDWIRAIRPRD